MRPDPARFISGDWNWVIPAASRLLQRAAGFIPAGWTSSTRPPG